MPGFVEADLARAGDLELRDQAPALVLDRRHELDPLALQLLDAPLDVVAHEEQDVMPRPAAPPRAGMDRYLARRQGEDQPAVTGVHALEAQHVTEERPGAPSFSGMVSVTTMPASGPSLRISKARPEKRPCVATAKTSSAPSSSTVWAAALSVPPVAMMSSTITAVRFFTSPITYPISATCWAGRSFSIRA